MTTREDIERRAIQAEIGRVLREQYAKAAEQAGSPEDVRVFDELLSRLDRADPRKRSGS